MEHLYTCQVQLHLQFFSYKIPFQLIIVDILLDFFHSKEFSMLKRKYIKLMEQSLLIINFMKTNKKALNLSKHIKQ